MVFKFNARFKYSFFHNRKYFKYPNKIIFMSKRGFNKWFVFFVLLIGFILAYSLFKKFGLSYMQNIISDNYAENLENIIIFIVIMILNYFFIKFTSSLLKSYLISKGEKRDVKLLISVYRYFEWVFIIIVTYSILFKQIGSLITSFGLIGFGITFALQKPILNFVGWLNIVFNHVYKFGDKVTINNINGQVYDVKLMYTALAELNQDGDLTGKSVTVPNEFVLTGAVLNFTKGTNFIWDSIKIYITYESNWKKALKLVEKIVQDYYDKNIKNDMKKQFKNRSKEFEKVIIRLGMYDKGIIIKVRYMVDFDRANMFKSEINKSLLEKLLSKDIILGKIEDIKASSYKPR